MPENLTNQENEEKPEVNKEELASITHVIQSLTKAAKAFKIYLPNNPLHKKFFEQLTANMDKHLEDFGDLKLEVEQFEMKFRRHTVYQNIDAKDSLAFKLNSDGLTSISFLEGIEKDEVYAFLDIIGQEAPYETDDDIVTRLWTKNLPHIQYEVSEDDEEFDSDSIGTGRSSSPDQKERVEQASKSIPKPPPLPTPLTLSQSILTLTDKEIAWLKQARNFEEKRRPVDDVISILTAILLSTRELTTFRDFLSVTVNLIRDLIEAGEVHYSLELINFVLLLNKRREAPDEFIKVILEAKKSMLSEEMISGLEKIVDQTDRVKPVQLKKLILMFGKEAIKPMCNLLGVASRKDMRKVLIESLVEIGRDQPEEFFSFLKDERWYLVRNAVLILRLIGDPTALNHIRNLISHKDPRIRKEVLFYLQTISGEAAYENMLRFLLDKMSSLRVRALRTLVKAKYTKGTKQILKIIEAESFEGKELPEKKVFFEALGSLGSEEIIPFLREILMKKFWFNKSKEREDVICAASALRQLGSPKAIETLNEALSAKKGEVKEIVEQTLRAMAAAQTR
ncbi:MAG: HEAT repeat domain-containing protein [Deltaproteobacteria bacterium]|nr:HEAT repeat domain-containing protein [Deltaproteobacteria bacterium]